MYDNIVFGLACLSVVSKMSTHNLDHNRMIIIFAYFTDAFKTS